MPEGDSLVRYAHALNRVFQGTIITRFETGFAFIQRELDEKTLLGLTITHVTAHGKWCLIHFSDGRVLFTHLRMKGSWRILAATYQMKLSFVNRIIIGNHSHVALAQNVPIAKIVTADQAQKELIHLGPDVIKDNFSSLNVLESFEENQHLEIGIALLEQRLLAGIGNIYKSETCFICRVNPFTKVINLSKEQHLQLIQTAQKLLTVNASSSTKFRSTTNSLYKKERYWVYNRANQPCRTCATPIEARAQGEQARVSYYCPTCQPDG